MALLVLTAQQTVALAALAAAVWSAGFLVTAPLAVRRPSERKMLRRRDGC